MIDDALSFALRPLIPKIKKQAGKKVNELFNYLITEAEKELKKDNGEDDATIMVIEAPNKEIHLLRCAISKDDQILRIISRNRADQFTNQLMEKYL